MTITVIATQYFRRDAKKLLKKYRSLKDELKELSESLTENPKQGVEITENAYKIRLAVKSKGRGKSGGLRVITYVYVKIQKDDETTRVYLLTIYDKSDIDNLSDNIIKEYIDEIQQEIDKEIDLPETSGDEDDDDDSDSDEE